jgi:hypothetical protein
MKRRMIVIEKSSVFVSFIVPFFHLFFSK